jgi:hypothetical protein
MRQNGKFRAYIKRLLPEPRKSFVVPMQISAGSDIGIRSAASRKKSGDRE